MCDDHYRILQKKKSKKNNKTRGRALSGPNLKLIFASDVIIYYFIQLYIFYLGYGFKSSSELCRFFNFNSRLMTDK